MNTNKAPDKIYLVKDAANPKGVFDTVASKNPMFQNDVCYIRKDALLEWVKLAYGKLSMNPFDVQDVFEELINKLNSM